MKKIIFISGLALSLLTFTSCSDFLDNDPEGNPTTTQYFTSDQQAIDAIDALYQPLSDGDDGFGRELFWEQAAACDVVWGRTRGYPTLATMKYTGDESPLTSTFELFYSVMSRANWVISKLVQKSDRSDIMERSLGEAYFMRGFCHFWIAHRYGLDTQGVPFVRYEDFPDGYDNSIPPQQATVMDNYKLIIEDMDSALLHLPKVEEYGDDDFGRANAGAAVALKAKTYAYWATWDESQWQNVISMVNLLETEYGRGLADTFADNFTSDTSKWNNVEYLFSIPGNGGADAGGVEFPGIILENKGWGIYNGWGQNKPSYDIYEEMAKDGAGNDRLVRSILEYNQEFPFFGETRRFYSSSDIESGFMINKYMEPFGHANATTENYVSSNGDYPAVRINFPLMRFAEMLLFRAEAYLMTGNATAATEDLNQLRERSNLADLDHTATMADLYHERRCELAFEYTNHLFDLKRWARSSNAEIKALALAELNAHPRARHYADRLDPTSTFTIGDYEDYKDKATYDDHLMVFPYPSNQITKSGGKLKQNPGYGS